MIKFLITVLFMLFATSDSRPIFIPYEPFCPSGDEPTRTCSSRNPCDKFNWCSLHHASWSDFRIRSLCCPKNNTHCKDTGLPGFTPSNDGNGQFVYGDPYYDADTDPEYWYEVISDSKKDKTLKCSIPYPFQLMPQGMHLKDALPKDFHFGKPMKKMRRCQKSHVCDLDEFCGPVYNPTYCNVKYGDWRFNTDCLDSSDNGAPAKFCYPLKAAKLHETFEPSRNDDVALRLCDNTYECVPGSVCVQQDTSRFPYIHYFWTTSNYKTMKMVRNHKKTGICGTANVCNPLANGGSAAGRMGNLNMSCVVGNDRTCGEKLDYECIAAPQFQGQGFCCKKYEENFEMVTEQTAEEVDEEMKSMMMKIEMNKSIGFRLSIWVGFYFSLLNAFQ